MRNNLLFLFVLFVLSSSIISNRSAGQSATFTFKYSTLSDEVPTHSIETSDGGFIISAKQGTMNPYSFHAMFIRLNKWGDTIKTVTKYDSTGNCFVYQLLPSEDGNYFAIGTWQYSALEMNFWLIKLNSNLDILWEKRFETTCYNLDIALGLLDHSHTLILYGNGYFNPTPNNSLLIYRCNQNGDSINGVRLSQPSHHAMVYDMAEKTDSSGYYLLIEGRYLINTNSWGQILRINNSLNITNTDSIPRSLFHYYNLLTIGEKILITGSKQYTSPLTNKLGFLQLDTAYNVIHERYIGPDDTISYPGYIHNLDLIDTLNIYYAGTLNQDNNAIFSPKKTWFILGKYDVNLNVKWQKFYGGDLNYGLWSLKATSDGGCLMAGSTYNYLTQNNERDIFILKVDSDGIITGGTSDKTPVMHDVAVYPNPGTDYLTVDSGPQISGAQFRMTTIDGRQVIAKTLAERKIIIETPFLSPGTYVWQIVFHNRVIETGKWISH